MAYVDLTLPQFQMRFFILVLGLPIKITQRRLKPSRPRDLFRCSG